MVRIVLVGGGGHASDVLGVIEAINDAAAVGGEAISVAGILDDGDVAPARFAGRGVEQIGALSDLASIDATHFVLAVGWPKTRRAILDRIAPGAPAAATLVHPSATVSRGVSLGEGAVVMAGVHLSPLVSVGAHACLSNHAVAGHDAVIGRFSGLMPAAVISGGTTLGEGCLIGTNATVVEGVSMGAWSTLGAGGVAIRDIDAGATVVGVPARWPSA